MVVIDNRINVHQVELQFTFEPSYEKSEETQSSFQNTYHNET